MHDARVYLIDLYSQDDAQDCELNLLIELIGEHWTDEKINLCQMNKFICKLILRIGIKKLTTLLGLIYKSDIYRWDMIQILFLLKTVSVDQSNTNGSCNTIDGKSHSFNVIIHLVKPMLKNSSIYSNCF